MALLPVLDRIEAVLVGDIVHQYETHGTSVIGGGNRPVSLLTSGVLKIQ